MLQLPVFARSRATLVHGDVEAKIQVLYLYKFNGNSPTNMKAFCLPIDWQKIPKEMRLVA